MKENKYTFYDITNLFGAAGIVCGTIYEFIYISNDSIINNILKVGIDNGFSDKKLQANRWDWRILY